MEVCLLLVYLDECKTQYSESMGCFNLTKIKVGDDLLKYCRIVHSKCLVSESEHNGVRVGVN